MRYGVSCVYPDPMTTTAYAPEAADLAAYEAIQHPTSAVHLAHLGTTTGVDLAAGDRDLLVGVSVVKPGIFNGVFEVTRDDLDAWVQRFGELLTTFRPPMRLDHSWNIMSVIGRFEALRVENRPDESAGGTVVPMLVGDIRLVGTPEENAQIKAWIKSGKLLERSSEFWSYRTNTGAEYPSVFAGCAFVDIPAVEGLGSITLRREGATLASNGTTPTGDATVTALTTDPAPTDAPPASADELGVDEVVGTPPPVDDEPAGDEPVEPVEEDTDEADEVVVCDDPADEVEVEEEAPPVDDTPVAPPADLAAALSGVNLSREQLAAIDAHVAARVALRVEADNRLARFTDKGVIPLAVRPQVEALLRHGDAQVRDGIAALLDIATSPVALKARLGAQTPAPVQPREDGTLTPSELRELERGEEFGKAWAALTTDQRSDADYLAAYRAVMLGETDA
jgi:hypothetical protein